MTEVRNRLSPNSHGCVSLLPPPTIYLALTVLSRIHATGHPRGWTFDSRLSLPHYRGSQKSPRQLYSPRHQRSNSIFSICDPLFSLISTGRNTTHPRPWTFRSLAFLTSLLWLPEVSQLYAPRHQRVMLELHLYYWRLAMLRNASFD